MILQELSVVNFKNLKGAEVQLNPKINCFVGNNGQGKTTLLDAIYYLSFCKSFLNSSDVQNIKIDEQFFVLQGTYLREQKKENVYCGLKRGQKKIFKRNQKEYAKLSDHIGNFPLVMIAPSDSNLIALGSDLRRKFLDGIIAQFDHAYLETLLNYNKALLQRNSLLKYFRKEQTFKQEQLELWDMQLIQFGEVLHRKREQLVKELTPVFQKYYQIISGGNEVVELRYVSQLSTNSFADLLYQARNEDRRRLFSTVGTHKDDLDFKISGGPLKRFGSQGQQKSFLVALKLAQLEFLKLTVGIDPILLLDDVFDKLDAKRVEAILQMVNSNQFGQIFLSDTHPERIKNVLSQLKLESSMFLVDAQEIKELT